MRHAGITCQQLPALVVKPYKAIRFIPPVNVRVFAKFLYKRSVGRD
jgi:hypothetical protein